MTPEELIAEQDATITELRTKLAAATETEDGYWGRVYDRVLDAWAAFGLAELGTARPSPLDLQGRPELLALYEAIK